MKTGQIYKIEADGELLYIGSTTNMTKRKYAHKSCCFNDNDNNYNKTLYQSIRNKGINKETFKERVKMIWICNVEFVERYELTAVEAHYIKELNPICNINIPYDKEWDRKQYEQDNKDKISIRKKMYYENNKDYLKQYKQKNKNKIKEYKKQYNQKNKDKIKEYDKQYYQNNKEKRKKRRRSDKSKRYCMFCKYKYDKTPSNWIRHTKTDKHKRNTTIFREDVIDTIECRLIHV